MNNHFFSLCDTDAPQRKSFNDMYSCCVGTCTARSAFPHLCYSMCAQVFPMMKERCAFEEQCWRDGFYNKKCLEAKAEKIHQCCVNRCEDYQRNPQAYDRMDCQRYCSDYTLR